MKSLGPNPRVRFIKLHRGTRVLLGTACYAGNGSNSVPNTPDSVSENRKAGDLLLLEMQEINQWARTAFQLYFGWFALQFTINGLAMGWQFTHQGPVPWFANLTYMVLIGWNLMGTFGTILVYKGLTGFDLRINELTETLAKESIAGDSWAKPKSPIPLSSLSAIFLFCTITMFISLSFWVLLALGGR